MNRVQGIILIAVAFFLSVSLFSYTSADLPDSLVFPAPEVYENWCGKWGAYTASILLNSLGVATYFLFLPLARLVYCRWKNKPIDQLFLRMLGFVLVLAGISGLACLNMTGNWHGPMIGPGGYFGVTLVYFLNNYFSSMGMAIIFVCMLLGGLVLASDYLIMRIILWVFGLQPINNELPAKESTKREKLPKQRADHSVRTLSPLKNRNSEIDETGEEWLESENSDENNDEDSEEIDEEDAAEVDEEDDNEYWDSENDEEELEKSDDADDYEYTEDESEEELEAEEPPPKPIEQPVKKSNKLINWLRIKQPKADNVPQKTDVAEEWDDEQAAAEETVKAEYHLPAVDLLIESEQHDDEQQMQIARRQAKQLEKAFADFGLNVKVVDIQCGPVIAQFEVELERGLRLNKIIGLTDDLAIALRVPTVRIVAPIPGKNTVGVEVPNATRQLVRLREVIEETPEKVKSKTAIPIFLGKDVAGAPMMLDLAKMPHLLIAGRTGTGKSVCLNSIIVSMLMTKTPEECRMIMIDPKMVELSQYESIPHLMHPVVIDMKKAEAILAWAVEKMEQRYKILNRAKVRQLSEYNALSEEELYRRVQPQTEEEWDETPRSLPYMVIVVDEMADLMMTAAKEVETHIIRIAQKSRAVGIHLVLATQKPTVDIITGLIKSNLPARIAFEVATRVDSQVVLDRNGAEKLLGNGDMLFLKPGTSQVLRGQGTYVSDPEINDIIASIATDSPDYVVELVELQTGDEAAENIMVDPRDELFNEAVEYIIREGRGSVSLLQRKFKIGYGRAARLVDFMEEDGIVGPSKGSQPRDVILTLQQWRARLAELENAFNATKAVEKQQALPPAEMNYPPKPKGMATDKAPVKDAKPRPKVEPIEAEQDDNEHNTGQYDDEQQGYDKERRNAGQYEVADKPLNRRPGDGAQNRQHGKHDSGRDSSPKIRVDNGKNVEPGLGPIANVDDSMLAEVQPNDRRQKPMSRQQESHQQTPDQRKPSRREAAETQYDEYEESPPFAVYDGGDYDDAEYGETEYEPDVYDAGAEAEDLDGESENWDEVEENQADENTFGVVPIADGDVPFDADDGEWEYEYEYVYEEVDTDEGELYDDDIDPKKHYVEEINLEAGGEWESEEDWDDDVTEEDEPDDEEYEEDDNEYEENGDDWDEDDWADDETIGRK